MISYAQTIGWFGGFPLPFIGSKFGLLLNSVQFRENTHMTLTKKFSALVAVLVVGFLSIYASGGTFMGTNQTANQVTITLNMASGAQLPMNLAPGQTLPMGIGSDQVVGLWLYGAYVPAGVNAVVANPSGGNVDEIWQMGPNGTPCGGYTEPDHGTIS